MAGKFEINRAKDGQFYFNLKARNGQVILTSEMYTTKANTHSGITSVMTMPCSTSGLNGKPLYEGNPILC